ncbi:hypothetical protein, partial [uncultured Corynebacterium sp.]|uniref:hypothetical protein n=1 Tax=uncultured Corynebacterium sp. TaxID=159447 RepID=UPI0025F20B1A
WIEPWGGAALITLTCSLCLGIARWWDQVWLAFIFVVTGGLFLTPAALWLIWDDRSPTVTAGCLLILGVLGWASTLGRFWLPVDIAAALVFVSGVGLVPAGDAPALLATSALIAVVVLSATGLFPVAPSSTTATVVAFLARWIPASLVPALTLLNIAVWSADVHDTGPASARWCALAIALVTCVVPVTRQALAGESLIPPPRTQAPPHSPPAQFRQPGYPVFPVPLPAVPASVADTVRAALATGLAALWLSLAGLYSNSAWSWWLGAVVIVAATLVWFSPVLPPAFPWSFGVFTVLACLHLLGPAWTRLADSGTRLPWLPLLLLLAVGVLVLYRRDALHLNFPGTIVVGGVLLILGTSAIPLIAREISDTDNSFMTGHLVISVLWMLVGVFLLLRVNASVGLGITLLTTAKLALYDLAALDGLIKVAAFILCGLILLASAAVRDRSRRATVGNSS